MQYIFKHKLQGHSDNKVQVQMCHLSAPDISSQTAPVTMLPLTSVQNAQTEYPAMQKIGTEFVTGFFNLAREHGEVIRSSSLLM